MAGIKHKSLLAVAIVALCISRVGLAELWIDPEPPMTWDAILECELVIVAQYVSHQGSEVRLKIVDVLKGDAQRGQELVAKLEHLYTAETGRVGWNAWLDKDSPQDGVPKLCYKAQIVNPGDLVPVPVLNDARQAAIYFFPKASAPALRQRQQVQAATHQQGWQQALDGKRMNLLFRLTQDANAELGRDALEELGKTRDSAVIERLFEWVLNGVPELIALEPSSALARLGDKEGDVYDRAARLLDGAAVGKNGYRFHPLAALLPVSDQARASADLPRLVVNQTKPLLVRQAALVALARIGTREAAELAIMQLRNPELGQAAVHSARAFLRWDSDLQFPKTHRFVEPEWMLEQLRHASGDDQTPANVRKAIAEQFGHALRKPEPLDLEQLRRRLLDSSDRSYQGWADGPTNEMLRVARDACDPKLIPVLTEVLDKMPEASGNHGYGFQETLKFYATICPRRMAEELQKRGLSERLARTPSWQRSYVINHAMEAAQLWPPRFLSAATDEIDRCFRLAQRVRDGMSAEADLITATDQLVAKHELSWTTCQGLVALLDAGTPAARERFFHYVDDARRVRVDSGLLGPRLGSELDMLLSQLFPKHMRDYVGQLRELLESKSLLERKAGLSVMASTLQSDFDFDPEALEADRILRLADIHPWLERQVEKAEWEMRVSLLSRTGMDLMGEPNDGWLPQLTEAASGNDDARVGQALQLIEIVLGEQRCHQFVRWPQAQRARALQAYLRDAGKLR